MENNNEKPLTLNELAKYNKEILFPFIKENFATKKEIEYLIDIVATKEEMKQGFDKIGNDIKEVKSLLIDFGARAKTLKGEVDFIKNSLNIQPIKK